MRARSATEDYWGTIRRRLATSSGKRFWRSLEELADSDDFRLHVEAEFPSVAPLLTAASRRDVLRVMGASLGLAGLTGCGLPEQEKSVPYVNAPEFQVPGEPRYYATATLLNGYAFPVIVRTIDGRPIKVEGNPDHPISRGTADTFAQAAVLGLYDPDRSSATTHYGRIASWNAFQLALVQKATAMAERRGEGLALLTGAVTSPTSIRQIHELRSRFPALRWYVDEPVGNSRRYAATTLAFGEPLEVRYRLDRADVVLSLDDDFLGPGPAQILHARQWVERRRTMVNDGQLPDLHVLESTPSLTGSRAGSRVPASTTEITNFALALAQEFGLGPTGAPDLPLAQRAHLTHVSEELKRAGRAGLVLTGAHLPADIQALGFAINQRLGSRGHALETFDPIEAMADRQHHALVDLPGAISAGDVDTLLILDANPVYTAPADLVFGDLLERVPLRVHVGAYADETAALCHWHVPLAHPFETWTDARAVDGTASVIQPLVRPLFGGRSVHEVLATLTGEPQGEAHEIVRSTWRSLLQGGDFEPAWRKVLEDGFALDTRPAPRSVAVGQIERA